MQDLSTARPTIGPVPVTVDGLMPNGTVFTGPGRYVLPESYGTFRAIASPYCAGDHRTRAAALEALRTFKAPA